MKKGITSFFGYIEPMETNIKLIKEAGFSSVMCSCDKKYEWQNGTLDSQVKLIKKYGLNLGSLHSRYNEEYYFEFWKDTKQGYQVFLNYLEDIDTCSFYKFTCLVLHIYGKPSIIGKERFRKMLEYAKSKNVILAIENLIDLTPFYYLLDNFKDENLKVCLDIGHINCFTRNYDIYDKIGDRIYTTHLHDNNGISDLHTTSFIAKDDNVKYKYKAENYFSNKQNVNFDEFAKCVAKNNLDISLDYELNNNVLNLEKFTPKEILDICFNEANNLEKLIFKHKKRP